MLLTPFSANTGACLRIAAAVLEVGKEETSPKANTFGYRLCCNVSLFTSTQPKGLFGTAKGLSLIKSGALCGGVT